jgi:hypothetical protein
MAGHRPSPGLVEATVEAFIPHRALSGPSVMSGLGPDIRVFAVGIKEQRGVRPPVFAGAGCAGHDDWGPSRRQLKPLFRTGPLMPGGLLRGFAMLASSMR